MIGQSSVENPYTNSGSSAVSTPALQINKSEMRFQQMENIGNFLSAVEVYGVRPSDSFQTVDLYEKQNIFQVVNTLVHLKNTASKVG